jgi:hypothetical protein
MLKKIKIFFIVLIALFIVGIAGFYIMKTYTKSHSPEETVTFTSDDVEIEVYYNRPLKKGRDIFGGLVPYNEVWRTGANEATTFKINQDIKIEGEILKAGKYTLWTIPNKTSWEVIFNEKMYGWGVNFSDGKASRDPNFDALSVGVPISKNLKTVEQFRIDFNEQLDTINMFLAWDDVVVSLTLEPVLN